MLPPGGLSNICEQATPGSIVGLNTTSRVDSARSFPDQTSPGMGKCGVLVAAAAAVMSGHATAVQRLDRQVQISAPDTLLGCACCPPCV